MKYTKKVVKTAGGFMVRIPADIVELLQLSEKDFVEVDIARIDREQFRKKK